MLPSIFPSFFVVAVTNISVPYGSLFCVKSFAFFPHLCSFLYDTTFGSLILYVLFESTHLHFTEVASKTSSTNKVRVDSTNSEVTSSALFSLAVLQQIAAVGIIQQ